MPTKPIDRLLFAQGGLCFFCNKTIPKDQVSVEHLLPKSRSGSNADDNCVACCKSVNNLFGSMSLKEKIRVILNQKGNFSCPLNKQVSAKSTPATAKSPPQAKTIPAKQALSTTPAKTPNPIPAPSNETANSDLAHCYTVSLAKLKGMGTSRPRKLQTLRSTVQAAVKNQAQKVLDEAELQHLIDRLVQEKKVVLDETKVSYKL